MAGRHEVSSRLATSALVALTFVTGLLDAVTYLSLGHVFAANQTGNIIVLGFALAGAGDVSASASVVSLGSFFVGAACSGWTARTFAPCVQRWLSWASAAETCLLGVAALTTVVPSLSTQSELTVGMLALAMGMRTVTVQRIGTSASTTVVTSTLATLADDLAGEGLAGWQAAQARIAAAVALVLGAASGAVVLQHGPTVVLALASLLTLAVAVYLAYSPASGPRHLDCRNADARSALRPIRRQPDARMLEGGDVVMIGGTNRVQEDRTEIIETPSPAVEHDGVEAVAYDPFEGRRLAAHRITQLVNWIFVAIEGLLAIRLVLVALGANPSAGFAQFIYGISAPLVSPFVGLFSNVRYQGGVLDMSAAVGLIVYAVIAWLLVKLVWIVVGETRSAVRTRTTRRVV